LYSQYAYVKCQYNYAKPCKLSIHVGYGYVQSKCTYTVLLLFAQNKLHLVQNLLLELMLREISTLSGCGNKKLY